MGLYRPDPGRTWERMEASAALGLRCARQVCGNCGTKNPSKVLKLLVYLTLRDEMKIEEEIAVNLARRYAPGLPNPQVARLRNPSSYSRPGSIFTTTTTAMNNNTNNNIERQPQQGTDRRKTKTKSNYLLLITAPTTPD